MFNRDAKAKDFNIGDIVEIHPATSAWMSGDRFGTVFAIGRKLVAVNMHRSGKLRRLHPIDLSKLD